jgi:hypothetical protein
MTVVVPCDICGRSFRSADLYWIRGVPPEYIDLPETAKHVDPEGTFDSPEISLHYCGACISEIELPPVETESDGEQTPDPYRMPRGDTAGDDGD